jgi:antitoxin (DNA-binding transcriptional repressor) of toxin-antitoxin stability system
MAALPALPSTSENPLPPGAISQRPRRLDSLEPGAYLGFHAILALKTLEGQVTEYVSLAQRGETDLITDQDHVIAELTPPREARRDPLVDNPALAEAVRNGWITPAEIVSDEPPPRLPFASLKELLQELDEDRADR